ncbi:hypothetical protein F4819DRAFT_338381 [Hypoxylon fuscum]|nr:hypothetical protein F4819DRAFT_338381 [Hypoxylon fuscum]
MYSVPVLPQSRSLALSTMVTKNTKFSLDELNYMHLSYLKELRIEFHQQFLENVDKGRKYREEFSEFVRLKILLPPNWEDATYKPPLEVVSRFKEWKIADLEKKLALAESRRVEKPHVIKVFRDVATSTTSEAGSLKCTCDQRGTSPPSTESQETLVADARPPTSPQHQTGSNPDDKQRCDSIKTQTPGNPPSNIARHFRVEGILEDHRKIRESGRKKVQHQPSMQYSRRDWRRDASVLSQITYFCSLGQYPSLKRLFSRELVGKVRYLSSSTALPLRDTRAVVLQARKTASKTDEVRRLIHKFRDGPTHSPSQDTTLPASDRPPMDSTSPFELALRRLSVSANRGWLDQGKEKTNASKPSARSPYGTPSMSSIFMAPPPQYQPWA